ncbi:hypothetical protein [Streptomyces sp. NRRL B-24720]|uniref:hypothetical protein n=1 Tax=Streptomyces sp. NRRL B-24720 TaxID=1476876 RepID=UPI0004CB1E04|nr:hypothetical protein [Streptomyces sp. NRRL B-24720]
MTASHPPQPTDTDLRAALADLARRYEAIANRATTVPGRQRAQQIRKAAGDIRHVLATGHVPAYLATDTVNEERAS